ncbi:MAG: sugar ABC transporter substrate-binding protein, partial [Candidatus Brocadiae bacterium]|nr:sugar ABC transporter substrate-binding protein [Candidatus Brocadiia bacterium]
AAAGLLAGCGDQGEGPKAKGKGGAGKPRIALVMKSLANEFFKTMEDGAHAHQKQNAGQYELIANGIKDERDVEKQRALVAQMIAQGVDAIVIAPADSKAMVSVCKKALDAGIVVVNIDNKLDAGVLKEKGIAIPFVGPDNRKGARLAGEYCAKKLEAGDQIAIVEGIPNAINGILRKQGFEDAAQAAKLIIASSQTAYWETDKAEKVVSGMVTQHADVKAVWCANDSMALGAVAALKAAGKLDAVAVVGFDNISAVQQLMKEGKVLCTVDQHADQIAVYGILFALDILNGKAKPADKETPVDLVTAADLK